MMLRTRHARNVDFSGMRLLSRDHFFHHAAVHYTEVAEVSIVTVVQIVNTLLKPLEQLVSLLPAKFDFLDSHDELRVYLVKMVLNEAGDD